MQCNRIVNNFLSNLFFYHLFLCFDSINSLNRETIKKIWAIVVQENKLIQGPSLQTDTVSVSIFI